MPTCGIYKLSIVGDDGQERFYYGRSVDIERRIKHHMCDLKAGRHRNARVRSTYSKYGNVSHSVVAVCDESILPEVEGMFIHTHHSDPMCMNLEIVDPSGAVRMCKETAGRIAASLRGKKKSAKHSQSLSEVRRGVFPQHLAKPVVVFAPSGEFYFSSAAHAARYLGAGRAQFTSLLRGERRWPSRGRIAGVYAKYL